MTHPAICPWSTSQTVFDVGGFLIVSNLTDGMCNIFKMGKQIDVQKTENYYTGNKLNECDLTLSSYVESL